MSPTDFTPGPCQPKAQSPKPALGKQLANRFAKVDSFSPLRQNFRLTEEVEQKFTEKLRSPPSEFSGSKVASVVRPDALKLVLGDGSWMCYRPPAAKPVVRIYSEARSREDRAGVTEQG